MTETIALWILGLTLGVLLGIISFFLRRVFKQNDDQLEAARALENELQALSFVVLGTRDTKGVARIVKELREHKHWHSALLFCVMAFVDEYNREHQHAPIAWPKLDDYRDKG